MTFEELLEKKKDGLPFTDEERAALYTLTKAQQKAVTDVLHENAEKARNNRINAEFVRVYNKLRKESPATADRIDALTGHTNPNGLMEDFHDLQAYNLNEVMVVIIQDPDTPEDIREIMKERIYEKNIGLIGAVLKRYSNKDNGKWSMEDMGQEAKKAFFEKVVEKFNIAAGTKFSTFATVVIHNTVVGLYTSKINKMNGMEQSLFDTVDNNNNGTSTKERIDFIADTTLTAAEQINKDAEESELYKLLNKLPPLEKFIIYCCFGLDGVPKKSQSEIAEYTGMSQANVSKHLNAALAKLKILSLNTGMY